MDDQAQLVDESGIKHAARQPGATDEIYILAGLLLERGDVVDTAQEPRIRPGGGGECVRYDVVRRPRGEARPVAFAGRGDLARHWQDLGGILVDRRPITL